MRKLITILLFLPLFSAAQTFTSVDTTITVATGVTWKVSFRVENTYYSQNGVDSTQMIIFFPGAGEAGTGYSGLRVYGPLDYIDGGWDGGVVLGNGTHYPVICAVEQIGDFPYNVKERIDEVIRVLTNRFRIKTKNGKKCVHVTGLSAGGYCGKIDVMAGSTQASRIMSIADVQGMKPDDYPAPQYPNNIDYFANAGGRMVSFEGASDGRDHLTVINRMNATVSGSGIYYQLTSPATPMATHCCWNYMYGGNGSGTNYPTPAQLTFDGKTQDIYQWMLRQGDTTLSSGGGAPVASAGANQAFWFTTTSTTIDASGSADDGSITAYAWSKVSGPSGGSITSSTSATTTVTGLQRGIYTYQVIVTDNTSLKDTAQMTITVDGPPIVNAGTDQTISVTMATLAGSATDEGSIIRYKVSKLKAPGQAVKSIAVIGSSTSVPYTGGLFPTDSGWVNLLKAYYKGLGLIDTIYNLAQTSTNIYMGMPTGYTPPGGRDTVNPAINLTAAMNKPGVDLILVNYPTNGYDFMSVSEVMAAMRIMRDTANARGIPIWFTTTQTREGFSPTEEARLVELRDSITKQFPNNSLYFYINEPGTTNTRPECDLNDGTHMNGNGHAQIFKNTVAANPLQSCVSSSATITNPTSPTTTITGLTTGDHWFVVAAQDNDSLYNYDVVNITVNSSITANAGSDQMLYMPKTTATLSGSVTNGPATSVLWTKISGGTKSQEGPISSATSLTTTVSNIGVGVYRYELSVSDGVTTSKDTVVITGYAQKSRTPAPNYETFTLTPSGGEIYYTDLMASFPTLNGGDTLVIASNVSGVVQLYGAGSDGGWGGDSLYPVVIRPATGSSQITIGGAMRINGQYIRIMGEYNQSRGVQYGFKFNGSTQGIVATTKHSNLTAKWCEFTNVENGTYWKSQVDSTDVLTYYPNWKFNNDTVMYCKIHDTNGEGMYMGHTFFFDGGQPASGYQPVPHDGLYIGYDSVTNAGWDGIQISNAFNTTIEHNYINTTGTLNISSQLYGIIFGGLSWGTVRYNTIKHAASSGIAIFGKDTVRVYGNTIDSCGGTGIDAPFTSIYINDNTVQSNPYSYPNLIYYLQDNCISNMSSYSGGAAIRSTNSNGTTRASFITGNTIYDPSSRSLSSLISTTEAGTTKTNTAGMCVIISGSTIKPYIRKRSGVKLKFIKL